jgi:HEAT repeat protein
MEKTVTMLQVHIDALQRGDRVTRREAIASLKRYEEHAWEEAPPRIINAVVGSLKEQLGSEATQPFLRREIVLLLGQMGARADAAIPQLKELLADSVPHGIREAAASALGAFGKKARSAVSELVHLLASDRPTLVTEAVRALGNIGCDDDRVVSALMDLWQAPRSVPLHLEVAMALCKLKIEAAGLLAVLTNMVVTGREVPLRKAAALALGWRSKTDKDVVPALFTAALREKDQELGQMAEAALSRLGVSHDRAARLCVSQLGGSVFAEVALRQMGAAAVPSLIAAVRAADPAVRKKAVRILGSFGEAAAGAVTALTAALHDRDPEVRLAAAKSLWNITKNADRVVPALVALLPEKRAFAPNDAEARRRFLQTIIEALQRIGPAARACLPALRQKTHDENRIVCDSARAAIREISGGA